MHSEAGETISVVPTWNPDVGDPQLCTLVRQSTPSGSNGDVTCWLYRLDLPTVDDGDITFTQSTTDNYGSCALNCLVDLATIVYLAEDVNNSSAPASVFADLGTAGSTALSMGTYRGGDGDTVSDASSFNYHANTASGTSNTSDISFYCATKIGGLNTAVTFTWNNSDENAAQYFELTESIGLLDVTPSEFKFNTASVVLSGSDFEASQAGGTVDLGTVDVTSAVTAWNDTEITLDLTGLSAGELASLHAAGPGTMDITVTNDSLTEYTFEVIVHRPTAVEIIASNVTPGSQSLVITGTGDGTAGRLEEAEAQNPSTTTVDVAEDGYRNDGLSVQFNANALVDSTYEFVLMDGATPYNAYTLTAKAKLVSGSGAQDLTPSLFTNSQTYYTHVITTGVVDLTPDLFTNAQVFYTPLITIDITPDLFTNTNTFFTPIVAVGAVNLTPSLFTNSQIFHTPVITTGVVDVSPDDVFTNAQTYYTHVITMTVDLTPSLFTNSQTYYTHVITVGAVDLTPDLFTNSQTYFTHVVSSTYDLTPDLYTNSNTFFTPVITVGVVDLTPDLFTNSNQFFTPIVTTGVVDLTPDLFTNSQEFYAHIVTIEGGDQALVPDLYTNSNSFFTHVITTGAVDLTPNLYTNSNTFFSHVIALAGALSTSDYQVSIRRRRRA
jgi:energy-converting hydrogenase Eha subunit A